MSYFANCYKFPDLAGIVTMNPAKFDSFDQAKEFLFQMREGWDSSYITHFEEQSDKIVETVYTGENYKNQHRHIYLTKLFELNDFGVKIK